MSWTDADRAFMAQAIDLATARMGETWPNPAVGCVIVKDGRIIAQAATAPGGRPHAEEQAVPAAGAEIEGATVYVTLEPCGARSSGRQSCAHFLTEAGVERVVIACLDPSPFAAGRGTERLRAKGLTVETGLMCDEGAALPPPRSSASTRTAPYQIPVTVQIAVARYATNATRRSARMALRPLMKSSDW